MAKKLSKEEREAKEQKVKALEQENSDLVADLALLKLENEAEDLNATLQAEFDALTDGGGNG